MADKNKIAGKFQKKQAAAAAGGGEQKRSRYAGIKASMPRTPQPEVGLYRFRVVDCTEGHNPGKGTDSFKSNIEVVEIFEGGEAHNKGDVLFFVQGLSGKGAPAGLSRVKAYVMAAAGFEDEAEYDAMDPDGEFIAACTGSANSFSGDDRLIVGRLVDCQVTRGNDDAKGGWYREWDWVAVDDDEQG